ncbi:hypothetical protein HPP92_010414 [Vanilla planifolia]|uniref:Amino acid permease/ SLC12A domain-containing protein n=1 Tax=Vanilla planifolia TaxID=51239 RepID=A0A835QYY8_VANPL|nr:hypothetical protein HPP92_010414 [Vanilla planifolia]
MENDVKRTKESSAQISEQYEPVNPQDRAVIQMNSMDAGSPRKLFSKKFRVNSLINRVSAMEGSSYGNVSHKESKLELFGFDSLVNILGMKSMTGEHVTETSSPVHWDDVSINVGRPKEAGPKLGTMMGVFIPCFQNILGIIYYIRFTWIVGISGIGESLLLVAFCGSCTFLTGISLSAIATNGAMKGGGPYYLIGRALGPEVGVSIGLCFFLGTAVAGAMYVLGAVETFLGAVPGAGFFTDTVTIVSNSTSIDGTLTNVTTATTVTVTSIHDLQLYGVVVTILLVFIVFGGVKTINKVAPAFLIPVLLSLFCIFIGIFVAPKVMLQVSDDEFYFSISSIS